MMDPKLIKLIEENGLQLHGDIEYFAHLVAEQEREECAKTAEQTFCDLHIKRGVKTMRFYGTKAAKEIRARGQS